MTDNNFITVKELAERWSVNIHTIYNLVKRGELECYKIAGKGKEPNLRFSEEQISRYLEKRGGTHERD
jgi:excisionase family DNA binding protein